MLGAVKSLQLDALGLVQNVDSRFEVAINARGVGDQTHLFAFELSEAVVAQHLDTCLNLSGSGCCNCHSQSQNK